MSPYEIMVPGGSVEHVNEEAGSVWLDPILCPYPHAGWAQPGGAAALGLFGIHHPHSPAVFGAHVPDHHRRSRRRDEGAGSVARPVIPGWSEGPVPESRDSGFDASAS